MYRRSAKRLEPKLASSGYFSNSQKSATPVKHVPKEKLTQTETKVSQPNKSALTGSFDMTVESQGEQGMMTKTSTSAINNNPRGQKNHSALGLAKSTSTTQQQQVSRNRLANASAVSFTRSQQSLAGAPKQQISGRDSTSQIGRKSTLTLKGKTTTTGGTSGTKGSQSYRQ